MAPTTRIVPLLVALVTLAATASAETPAPERPVRDPIPVSIGAHFGGVYRADDPPLYVPVASGGLTLGAGALAWIRPWIAAGLAYEHTDLGRERSDAGPLGVVDLERDLSTVWATLRVAPLASDAAALYLIVGPGLSWQSVDAVGLVYTGPFAASPVAVRCEGSDSFDLALRGGAGVEGRLGLPGLALYVEASVDAHRLSSEPLGTCVPGAGTATLFGARAGAAYRFDVARFVR